MSTDSIPQRNFNQTINQDAFNVIKRVLDGDLVCRNLNGIALDQAGSLGNTTYRFLALLTTGLKISGDTQHFVAFSAIGGMTSDYSLTLPTQLPASTNSLLMIDNTGQMILIDPDSTLDSRTGPNFSVANQGITKTKIASLGQQVSANAGTQAYSNTTFVQMANQSITITTTGRPVFIGFIVAQGTDRACVTINANWAKIRFLRGSTEISRQMSNITRLPVSAIQHIDTPPAGTYTYSAECEVDNAINQLGLNSLKLIAFEYC